MTKSITEEFVARGSEIKEILELLDLFVRTKGMREEAADFILTEIYKRNER